jgi:hypothetical protein
MSLLPYTEFSNAICHKAQKAAAAMIQARIAANGLEADIPPENVRGGISREALTPMRVVCLCQNATAQEPWDGNWAADLEIEVTAPFADYEEDDFHALAGQVFAFFNQSREDTRERLSNADIKFTAFDVAPRGQTWVLEQDDEGKNSSWTSRARFEVQCCGSVIE